MTSEARPEDLNCRKGCNNLTVNVLYMMLGENIRFYTLLM